MRKSIPEKPIYKETRVMQYNEVFKVKEPHCASCDLEFNAINIPKTKFKYCPRCGQAIDWEEE